MTGVAKWFNVFGEEVDLDTIDSEYALNILMHTLGRARAGWTREELMADPLVQKLRERILAGVKPTWRDRVRGTAYNVRCKLTGLPYRAKGVTG